MFRWKMTTGALKKARTRAGRHRACSLFSLRRTHQVTVTDFRLQDPYLPCERCDSRGKRARKGTSPLVPRAIEQL